VDSRQGEKMAITKTIVDDKIEVVGDFKKIQVRTATIIKEDGLELTRSFNRRVISSVFSTYDGSSWTHTDTDMSSESTELQGIANAVWTNEVKNAQKTQNEKELEPS
tara:strand:- start:53 stop:373 length:321 start_codon:yes stop_codon:yes gene_type:complete